MSHPIYFNTIIIEAILIEQLAKASKNYISFLEETFPEIEEPPMVTSFEMKSNFYLDWLNDTVSSKLISCATRIRVLQDSYDFSVDDTSYSPDVQNFNNYPNLVIVIEGYFKNSIRECCNKIIHATEYELCLEKNENNHEYWNGCCLLTGSYNRKTWKIKVDISLFCLALRDYLEEIKYL